MMHVGNYALTFSINAVSIDKYTIHNIIHVPDLNIFTFEWSKHKTFARNSNSGSSDILLPHVHSAITRCHPSADLLLNSM